MENEHTNIVMIGYNKTSKEVITPRYQTAGSSGADIHAYIPEQPSIVIKPGNRHIIPTGLKLDIPINFEVQIRSRSGLAAKHGVFVLNSPGTIDSDYRGEIKVILFNSGQEDFVVKNNDRIAQMVASPVYSAHLYEAVELTETDRGEGRFGSTGN